MTETLTSSIPRPASHAWRQFGGVLACLLVVLALFFLRSFEPSEVLFSNDSPLGLLSSEAVSLPSALKGYWQDLNWIGGTSPTASPSYSTAVWLLINSPVVFAKFYAPISLLTAGLCAWLFFWQLGFSRWAAILAAIAVTLNMNTFSNACWGLPTRALTLAASFLALAALASRSHGHPWVKTVLGGFAVGLGIMEGFDIGAIFSLYIAAFVVFTALVSEGNGRARVVKGGLALAAVAGCAAFISACTLATLVGTQIKGIVGTQQDTQTREQRWDEATMWSLPKVETLRVIIPGLFGYRMDAPGGGNYWGSVGQQPGWEEHHMGLARHSGSGEYAGVAVVLVAFWALFRSLRRQQNSYSDLERKMIWFWAGAALVSLLLAFGRHAPFYRLIYVLPYFSTIRNPIKFMHPFHLCVLVLFAYGLEGLFRSYLAKRGPSASGTSWSFKSWLAKAPALDRQTVMTLVAILIAGIVGVTIYALSMGELRGYLQRAGFPEPLAVEISRFSLMETVWFLVFLSLSVAFVIGVMSGLFSGERTTFAGVVLGLILVSDLGHGDRHWIRYYDYTEMYSTNPVIDLLRDRPFDHRVAARLAPLRQSYLATGKPGEFLSAIAEDWLQHKYQFYNIQSLDIVQMPRMPEMDATYLGGLNTPLLSASEIRQLPSFISKLTNQADSVSAYLWQQFSPAAKAALNSSAPSAGPLLVSEINRILQSTTLYEQGRFAHVQLSAQTRALAGGRNLQGPDLVRLNRALLEDAFPNEIAPRSILGSFARLWQLTNTKYILGMSGYLDSVNQEMDPINKSFRIRTQFTFEPRQKGTATTAEDFTPVLQTNGPFAIFEYGSALARAQLFSHWQSLTNDSEALSKLADPAFDPRKTVLVANSSLPTAPTSGGTNESGTATITHYKPKHVVIQATAPGPSVLLLNDKFDPDWQVLVDGHSAPLLRCNYIMRGVYLEPGNHQVIFKYAPSHRSLYVSLAGVGIGLLLCGFLGVNVMKQRKTTVEPKATRASKASL